MYPHQGLRLRVVVTVIIIGFLGILLRIFSLQILKGASFNIYSSKQYVKVLRIPAERGRIFDRRGNLLSFDVPTWSLYARPDEVAERREVARKLADVLSMEAAGIEKQLSSDKSFVWIKRKLPKNIKDLIASMEIEGIDFIKEPGRFYPQNTLASHILGFVNVDNKGIEGLELYYDDVLKGQDGYMVLYKDARQQNYFFPDANIADFEGSSIVLTIDSFIQDVVEEELEVQARAFGAKSASCVVMDPYTGYILAMANWPAFSSNDPQKYPLEVRRNRAVTDMYEPGSVFKIITASAALDSGEFVPEDTLFCENGNYRVGGHILHDHRPHGQLTFEDVIVESSNIGVCKIAQKIGLSRVIKYARDMGIGGITGIDFPGESAGMLKPLAAYSKTSIAAVPMGQEVAVTCLQMAVSLSCIANGGYLVKPAIVMEIISPQGNVTKQIYPKVLRKVLSDDVAATMRKILYNVVDRGTGRRAKIEGLTIAGKTGTAQKPDEYGGYSHDLFRASFVGFYPVENPRVVISIVFDEPVDSHFGGVVAAPVFKRIIMRIRDYLEIDDTERIILYEDQGVSS